MTIGNSRASVSAQKLDGVFLDMIRRHVQLLPALDCLAIDASDLGLSLTRGPTSRRRVNSSSSKRVHTDVVNVFTLNLVGADGRPPQTAVDERGKELGDGFGKGRSGGNGFHRHCCDELEERVVGVQRWPGEVECRSDGCDGSVEHDGECLGNVEDVHGEDASLAIVEFVKDGVFCGSVGVYPAGDRINSRAIWFKSQSSCPYIPAGRTMVASGKASRTARSPAYLL